MGISKEKKKIYDAIRLQTPQGRMSNKISNWKNKPKNGGLGLICETVEELEGIYGLYLSSERCENCNCPYTKDNIKVMDHCHLTGKFRNILCHSCNTKQNNRNTSGIANISTKKNGWRYQIVIKGKYHSKSSTDLEWLKQYKLEYEKNNIYIH